MKLQALEIVAKAEANKQNILREYLQSYILYILQKNKFFKYCAFVGGTSLRFIIDIPRFSEDLDFSLIAKECDFGIFYKALQDELSYAGYEVEIKRYLDTTVRRADIKFLGLLHQAGLSGLVDQKLMIKLEIDTNPPLGYKLAGTLQNKYFALSIKHYDLNSLLSGKINALLTREYSKGRDYFDIFWLLSKHKIEPNLILLQNSLKQFGIIDNPDDWRNLLINKINKTVWKQVIKDVEVFLEDQSIINVFTKENMRKVIVS